MGVTISKPIRINPFDNPDRFDTRNYMQKRYSSEEVFAFVRHLEQSGRIFFSQKESSLSQEEEEFNLRLKNKDWP